MPRINLDHIVDLVIPTRFSRVDEILRRCYRCGHVGGAEHIRRGDVAPCGVGGGAPERCKALRLKVLS